MWTWMFLFFKLHGTPAIRCDIDACWSERVFVLLILNALTGTRAQGLKTGDLPVSVHMPCFFLVSDPLEQMV